MQSVVWKGCGLFLFLLVGQTSLAQSPNSRSFWQRFNPDSLTSRNLRFVPLPVLQSSPETGLKGGLALDYFFNTAGSERLVQRRMARGMSDSLLATTRDSYAYMQALYSVRRQLTLEGVWQIYSPGETYIQRGRGGYQDYSEYYWGIGNQTVSERSYNDILYERWYLQHRMWRRVAGRFFAGLGYQYSETQRLRTAEPPALSEDIPGSRRSIVSGLGPTLLADYRNNPFSPTQGWYAEWALQTHFCDLGSQYQYTEQTVDLRRYVPLPRNQLVAFQVIGHFTAGTVPLRELPRLGGPNMMRGFVLGRYRDRQLWSAQTEYRRTLNRFLVGAVFVAAGGVADQMRNFTLETTRYSGGAGLRVLMNRKKNLYARFDLAVNSNQTANFYFRMMDAF
ncbi:hypothetical protein GCM10023189_20350 [Nibrella saemangeumensis]|uniref:Bacterial surface antigen (D15) domain-containing protein n=1 Tax=Nibrella saemangeumensis TaxID=1084526 RepID=A0ABP8MSC5_9BACT